MRSHDGPRQRLPPIMSTANSPLSQHELPAKLSGMVVCDLPAPSRAVSGSHTPIPTEDDNFDDDPEILDERSKVSVKRSRTSGYLRNGLTHA